MELQEWKNSIVEDAKVQIYFRNNMAKGDEANLTSVLSLFLEDGISIIKQWCKVKDDNVFTSGKYNAGLKRFLADKYLTNGREPFQDYSSGGIRANMKQSPEDRLKSAYKQVM